MDIQVSLTKELAKFVQSSVDSGRYGSSSDVIRQALRVLEEQERDAANLQRLKTAWQEGKESDDYRLLDLEAIKSEGRKRLSGKL